MNKRKAPPEVTSPRSFIHFALPLPVLSEMCCLFVSAFRTGSAEWTRRTATACLSLNPVSGWVSSRLIPQRSGPVCPVAHVKLPLLCRNLAQRVGRPAGRWDELRRAKQHHVLHTGIYYLSPNCYLNKLIIINNFRFCYYYFTNVIHANFAFISNVNSL